MKLVLLALALLAAPAIAQDVAEPAIRAELVDRLAVEQDVRQRLIATGAFATGALADPTPEVAALLAEMMTTDADNLAFVEALVDAHGWPTPALVGADGVNAAFLIVQHAPPDVQARMLPLAEAAFRAGDLPGQSYALLLDRVLVGRGEPQVYGTQAAPGPDGEMVIAPTVDDATLDARRAEVGLGTAAEYLATLKAVYAPPSE
ncbi:DUF6624 domain-containing protein [Rubrivirga sp. IMCC43871]|uniref:DUF6624 domain-containing protein n=1 Tax=Rubrivirga sp. IMCC43871 TaxID=3391575 RepID=UPI00398FCE71